MAGLGEEWLIWDKRFQFGYSCLSQRLKNNEEAMQQVAQLEQQTNLLVANSKQLDEANVSLKKRIEKLEQAPDHVTQLGKQIQDLTASCRTLKEENKVVNDRLLQLERETTLRDQENRLAQEQLIEKLNAQELNYKSMIAAMKGMNEIARIERGQRGEEFQQLKSQVEALRVTRHTPGKYARDGKSEERAMRRSVRNAGLVSMRTSQATTEDESMPIQKYAQQQQPKTAHRDTEVQGALRKAQAPFTRFEDHLRYAEKAFRRHETEALQTFVSSVQEGYRTFLSNRLEEHGE